MKGQNKERINIRQKDIKAGGNKEISMNKIKR